MCQDWTPAESLITALKQSRIDRETSDRPGIINTVRLLLQHHHGTNPGLYKGENCAEPGAKKTFFAHLACQHFQAGINAVKFHSLNSAFPGQSQAFTECSPYTSSRKNTPKPPAPPLPSDHPFILYLGLSNLNWAFLNVALNRVLL